MPHENTSKPSKIATTWEDYQVLPIRIPTDNTHLKSPIYHYLYLRRHNPEYTASINASPSINDRSLYVLNVPIDSTTNHFRTLFSVLGGGRVETVIFEDEPLPLRTAQDDEMVVEMNKSKKRKRGGGGVTEEELMKQEKMEMPKVWERKVHKSGCSAVIVFVDEMSLEVSLKAVKRQLTIPSTGLSLGDDGKGKEKMKQKLKEKEKEKGRQRIDLIWGDGVEDLVPPLGIERMNILSICSLHLPLHFFTTNTPWGMCILTPNIYIHTGYKTHFQQIYPSRSTLQQIVDLSLTAYDKRQDLALSARRKTANEPDEDGFITVVRHNRPKLLPTPEEMAEQKARAKKESEKGMYKDFYRFQQREVKKEQMQQLLSRFEEDKRKIQQLQHTR